MGAFVKGDVLIVRFPFTDLSGDKKRPSVVVANLPGEDMILCMITGQPLADADSIPLDNGDFASGSLQKPSNIRPNRLFTGANRIVGYQIGSLTDDKMSAVTDAVLAILVR